MDQHEVVNADKFAQTLCEFGWQRESVNCIESEGSDGVVVN